MITLHMVFFENIVQKQPKQSKSVRVNLKFMLKKKKKETIILIQSVKSGYAKYATAMGAIKNRVSELSQGTNYS